MMGRGSRVGCVDMMSSRVDDIIREVISFVFAPVCGA